MSIRLDRFITLRVITPGLRLRGSSTSPALPVLMYHSISEGRESRNSYYQTTTHPKTFAAQMEFLAANGYKGLALEPALQAFAANPQDPVVAITFDDGYSDFCTAAMPVLHRCNFTASMYLPTGYISDRRRSFNGRACLTWGEIRELRKMGMFFGAHTVTHPRLNMLPWSAVEREICDSKAVLDDSLGEATASFAFPYAFPETDRSFLEMFERLLPKVSLKWCVTTRIGRVRPGDAPFRLRRLPVNDCDDIPLFHAKLSGAYDWLGFPQRCAKHLKRFMRPSAPSQPACTRLPAPSA